VTDPLIRMLADLPQDQPDPVRSARVRARCHAALVRRGQTRARRQKSVRQLRNAMLGALGAIYLIETFRIALFFLV
jgi:hypothetical protein